MGAGTGRAALLERVARATMRYPFKIWGFGESIAMEALLAVGGAGRAHAAGLLEGWARDAGPLRADPLAHVAPGVPLLRLYEATGEPALLDRARELATILTGMPVGTSGARIHRPDLAGWEHEVWVDCMHLDGPFLAHLGVVTGESAWVEQGAELLLTHARALQDARTGLFSHGFNDATGWPNRVHWGRGQGWALLGLADTAPALPPGSPAREEAVQRLAAQVAGLAATEAESGAWHTVVDAPETYLEPSVGAFVALGVGRALRAGLVGGGYRALVARARAAITDAVAPAGELAGVSDATPVGDDAAHYGARGRGVFPWGQGPALLALLEAVPGGGESGG